MKLSIDDLLKIDEIGDKIAWSLVNYFNDYDNRCLIRRLIETGLKFHTSNTANLTSVLSNFKFVITGTYFQISREKLKLFIEENGGKVSSSLSKNTNYLILGENPGPSKLSKAKLFEIEMISLDSFLNKFKLTL